METKTKTIAEYKAPRCKCVEVHVNRVLCGSQDGIDDIDGDDIVNQNGGWGFGDN